MPLIGIKLYNNSIQAIGNINGEQTIQTRITTIVDNQETAEIELFLLEKTSCNVKGYLGKIIVNHIPAAAAGEPGILLKLRVTEQGELFLEVILNETAKQELQIPYNYPPEDTIQEFTSSSSSKTNTGDHWEITFTNKPEQEAGQTQINQTKKRPAEQNRKLPGRILIINVIIILIAIVSLLIINFFPGRKKDSPSLLPSPQSVQATPTAGSKLVPVATPLVAESEAPFLLSLTESPAATETSPPLRQTTAPPVKEPASSGLNESELKQLNTRLQIYLPVYFNPDSTEILPESLSKIPQLAAILREYRGLLQVTLTGHAADSGPAAGQATVATNRAKFIKELLLENNAITAEQVQLRSLGANKPVYTGSDKTRQYLNRRVEITLSRLAGGTKD